MNSDNDPETNDDEILAQSIRTAELAILADEIAKRLTTTDADDLARLPARTLEKIRAAGASLATMAGREIFHRLQRVEMALDPDAVIL